jgi:hypothetical protein
MQHSLLATALLSIKQGQELQEPYYQLMTAEGLHKHQAACIALHSQW